MKNTIFILVLLLILACDTKPGSDIAISQPVVIEGDDWRFEGTEHMLLVPENRNAENSRKIGLHFFRFPAKEKSTLPPVVFLAAGPGEPYSVAVFYKGRRAEAWRYELNFVNQNRDVILINQRGNSNAPGLNVSEFIYRWKNGGTLDKPLDMKLMNQNRRAAYKEYCEKYKRQGIDLRGYDIIHFIDDIEAIRTHLGYEKLALVGNSFGSQWALGYIQRYPENIDRALLSGVEPLDNNYDDPDGIWKVLQEINTYALQDPDIAGQSPEGGFVEAFKTIITRLEAQPQTVILKDDDGKDQTVVVGADDLRYNITNPKATSYISEITSWPKYINEMYNGDFRLLASVSVGRIYNSSSLIINPLVNNSLDISKERKKVLDGRASKQWLGDRNMHYTWTRDICPAPKVNDAFRQHVKHKIPMLLIHGDMDLSTPYENATFLMNYLENGHLITVKRGFHNAKRALIFADPALIDKVYGFMNINFEEEDFQKLRSSLPFTYEMPAFDFMSLKGESLYDAYIKKRNR